MKIPENFKTYFSLCLLAWIGSLFVFKYGARLFPSLVIASLFAALYVVIYLAALVMIQRIGIPRLSWLADRRLFLVVLAILLMVALAIVFIFPEASRVSRLFALREWLARLLSGSFPWSFSITQNPSGLPFLFILALPFDLLGNLGLLEVLGIVLFFISLTRLFPQPKARWLPLLALVLVPSFFYELLVRSELLFNISLVILLMLLAEPYLHPEKLDFAFFALAALFGLVLSTRTIVGVIYAAYYVFKFRQQVLRGIVFSGLTLLFFGLTLLPFIVWDPGAFFTQGPFYMQLLHLPVALAGLFVVLAAVAGWKAENFHQVIFLSGILLFLIVGAAFIWTAAATGLTASIINDGFDITYFIFCVPLLVLSLASPAEETALSPT